MHTRPDSIESRSEFGHFEVDTVESGRNGTGCVFTVVERKTRMLFACRAESCTAENFYNALKTLAKILPPGQSNHLPEIVERSLPGIRKLKMSCIFRSILLIPTAPGRKDQTRIQMAF